MGRSCPHKPARALAAWDEVPSPSRPRLVRHVAPPPSVLGEPHLMQGRGRRERQRAEELGKRRAGSGEEGDTRRGTRAPPGPAASPLAPREGPALLAPRFYPRETRRRLPELSDEFVLFTATAFVGICCCSCHTQSGLTPPSRTPSPRCPPARDEAAASTPVTQVGPGPSSVRPLLRGWRDPVTNRAGPCPTPSESKHPR